MAGHFELAVLGTGPNLLDLLDQLIKSFESSKDKKEAEGTRAEISQAAIKNLEKDFRITKDLMDEIKCSIRASKRALRYLFSKKCKTNSLDRAKGILEHTQNIGQQLKDLRSLRVLHNRLWFRLKRCYSASNADNKAKSTSVRIKLDKESIQKLINKMVEAKWKSHDDSITLEINSNDKNASIKCRPAR